MSIRSSLCCYCASFSEATTYTKGLYVKETAVKHSKHPEIACVKEVTRSQRQPEPRIYNRTSITLLVVSKAHRCDSKKEKKDVFPNFLIYNLCIISMLYVSVHLYLLSIFALCICSTWWKTQPFTKPCSLTSRCWACQHQDPSCQRWNFILLF